MKKKMIEISKYLTEKTKIKCYIDLNLIREILFNSDIIYLVNSSDGRGYTLKDNKETKEFLSQYFEFIDPKKEENNAKRTI